MRVFIEKLFIVLFCLYNAYRIEISKDIVFFFLISLIFSIILDLISHKTIKILIYFLFLTLCLYENTFIFYLPLILYNLYLDFNFYSLLAFSFFLIDFHLFNILLSFISIYLSSQTRNFSHFINENKLIRDDLKEDTIYLKKYNKQLQIDREKNIHIAILSERNRISREIHDSIGHSISSSILQVEALRTISADDTKESLNLLQNTLSKGMDDIRNSIHNLYNESLDLKERIEKICQEAISLDIDLSYNLEEPLTYDFKFDILSIIRESITNSIKHSNATKLSINLITQPKFHTIVIKDNGRSLYEEENLLNKGIGLLSMDEIARKYDGFLNYDSKDGFKIYISLMKG